VGATCTGLLFYSSNVIYIDYYYLQLVLNQTTMLQVHVIGLLPSYLCPLWQHTPRVNGKIPDDNNATIDHETLLER
jgi:hypothetical protein